MARAEIITVAKNAADVWRGTDTYHQAAKIIDMLVSELEGEPTITPPNEPLTCDGCYWQTHGSFGQCFGCFREKTDNYRHLPEKEEDT